MKCVFLSLLAFSAVLPLQAQQNPIMPPIRQPWPQLAKYLDLTGEQQAGLVRIEAEWQRFLLEKQRRVAEVERELARETNEKVPDPLSLGVRYAELEAICRESRDRDGQNIQSARKLLTPVQTTKLQTLEAAYALLPVVSEAAQANLLQAPELNRATPVSTVLQAIGVVTQGYPGCRYPAPKE